MRGSGVEFEVKKSTSLLGLADFLRKFNLPDLDSGPFCVLPVANRRDLDFAKAPRFLPTLMAVTDDDEEDLWAGLEDNDSKISVSSNLLEVRRASPPICRCSPPPCLAGSYHLMAADNGCSQLARPLTAPWPAKGGGSRSQG